MAGKTIPLSLVIKAVDQASSPLDKIQRKAAKVASTSFVSGLKTSGAIGLGKQFSAEGLASRSFGARLSDAATKLGAIGSAAVGVSNQIKSLGRTFLGIGAAGAAGLGFIVHSAEQAGSRLHDLSIVTGLNADEFAQLEFAFGQAGVSGDEFSGAMEKLNKNFSQLKRNKGPLAELLSKVGTGFQKQLKGAKTNVQALDLIATAMTKIEDPGKRAELATAAFGKAGQGLIAALAEGPEGLKKLRDRFAQLAGPQQKFADEADAMGDATLEAETAFLGLRNAAATALFPALTKLATGVADFVAKNRDGLTKWAERAGASIMKWVEGGGIDRLGESLKSTGTSILNFASGIGTLIDKLGGVEALGTAFKILVAAEIVSGLGSLAAGIQSFYAGAAVLGLGLGPATLALVAFTAAFAGAVAVVKHWDDLKLAFTGDESPEFKKMKAEYNRLNDMGSPERFNTDYYKYQQSNSFRTVPEALRKDQPEAKVTVDFLNLPKGVTVTPDKSNTADYVQNLGYSMAGG